MAQRMSAADYYREFGWSGCSGSTWDRLTDAARDGWEAASRERAMRDEMTREARLSREAAEKAVAREREGWASYAAEQERHAETTRKLNEMDREREAQLRARRAAERAVEARFARHEIDRALRAVVVYDSVASDEDVIFHDGAMYAVRTIREMLELDQ